MPAPQRKRPPTPAYVRKTTTLPKSLRDELVALGRLNPSPASLSNGHGPSHKGKKRDGSNSDSRPSKRAQDKKSERSQVNDVPASSSSSSSVPPQKKTALQKLVEKSTPSASSSSTPSASSRAKRTASSAQREPPRDPIEEQEEKEIAWLEAQLGVNRRNKGSWRAEFDEDGLGGASLFLFYR
jgi:hypothetical protein